MSYTGFVCELKEIRQHPNADRMKLATVFGNTVCVGLDYEIGVKCAYFPTDGQLSEEFCQVNDLVRRKNPETGAYEGGYMDPDKRNVKTIKLRGEPSDGLLLPISCLDYCFKDGNADDHLNVGDIIDIVNGHEICRKYIPRKACPTGRNSGNGNHTRKHKTDEEVIFPQHIDSPQLAYYLRNFKNGDLITITEKLEGTSHRSALLPVKKKNWLKRLFKIPETIIYKDFCGSRRVTIKDTNSGFYNDNSFRLAIHNRLVPHLTPNMEVFGEIVGWPNENSAPLMGEVNTTCLQDKAFSKKYGEKMIFHYGCTTGTYDFYIYRICELDNDGSVKIEYSTDQIIDWCNYHGFKYVPVLWRGLIPNEEIFTGTSCEFTNAGDWIFNLAEKYADGESTLASHWREGCVIRRDNNAFNFDVYKHKNVNYKTMKGLFVEKANAEDFNDVLLEEL